MNFRAFDNSNERRKKKHEISYCSTQNQRFPSNDIDITQLNCTINSSSNHLKLRGREKGLKTREKERIKMEVECTLKYM